MFLYYVSLLHKVYALDFILSIKKKNSQAHNLFYFLLVNSL